MKDMHIFEHRGVEILFHRPSSFFFELKKELGERLKGCAGGELPEDARLREVLDYIQSRPLLKSPAANTDRKLTRLTLLSTQGCNLSCKYCFANHGHYDEAVEVKMPFEVYKGALEYALEKYPEGIKLIQFFGGEPLLAFEEIKKFVPWCTEKMKERGLPAPVFSVVTNGTLFTEEMISFFNEYKLPVTISLDGPAEINDITRVSRGGWSVYDRIRQNVDMLNKMRSFPLLAEITLNKNHIRFYEEGKAAEWMREIHGMGFDGGVVGAAESKEPSVALTPEDETVFRKMYREICDYCFDNLYGEKPFCNFDMMGMIKLLTRKTAAGAPCSAATGNLTVTARGDILPCYILFGHEEFRMEGINQRDGNSYSRVKRLFEDYEAQRPRECRECWAGDICTLWCRGFGHTMRGDISTVALPRCWIAQSIAESVMANLALLKNNEEGYMKFTAQIMRYSRQYSYR